MTTRMPVIRNSWHALLLLWVALVPRPAAALPAKSPAKVKARSPARQEPTRPLHERSVDEILEKYTFVGDFEEKDAERPLADEIFWRYPYKLPPVEFPIHYQLDNPKEEMPATPGSGRAVDHLNRGRVAFLDGKYDEAKATWLSARARFGQDYRYHRRNDYFIGQAFMQLAMATKKIQRQGWDSGDVRKTFDNASIFLSWAFIVKVDIADDFLDVVTPKSLYNLAAIYWRYGRYGGAFGAAETGLNFLRKTGRRDYRPQLHRMVAESHIASRNYLEAAQELDTAIRQDRDPEQAAQAFARVGDMYFDLNNYELSADVYALAAKIERDLNLVNPVSAVLYGESLFWLGDFSAAQQMFHYALASQIRSDLSGVGLPTKSSKTAGMAMAPRLLSLLPEEMASWAALRIADAFLAKWRLAQRQGDQEASKKHLEAAQLEYYRVGREYRGQLAASVAKVRSACLELPEYGGQNIRHARQLLEEAKGAATMPLLVQEIAWACQVASYTQREKTADMLDRVRKFAAAYPESRFLQTFAEPVRDFQASTIETYFSANDPYRVLSFFEKNRQSLFPKVDHDLASRLFVTYADLHRAKAAGEFWDAYAQTPDSDLKVMRQMAVILEQGGSSSKEPAGRAWAKREAALAREMLKRQWTIGPDKFALNYMDRLNVSSPGPEHLPWLYRLAKHFGDQDEQYQCDLEYPLLSRLNARDEYQTLVADRVSELIKKQLPDLFKRDESCALSLLELEYSRLKSDPRRLAASYLQRAEWPLVAGFLHQYWMISEHINAAGDRQNARRLWQIIRDKGTPDAPEVEFAKARLEPVKTEFEKLWD